MATNINVFKDEPSIYVFQKQDELDNIYKRYLLDNSVFKSKEDLEVIRKKLLQMKKREQWPSFLLRPNYVGRMNKYSFTAKLPYIEGQTLDQYIETHNLDLRTISMFIKRLEDDILSEKEFVFPDIATSANIMIRDMDNLSYMIIDPDDVQFDSQTSRCISGLVKPLYCSDEQQIQGIDKCFNSDGTLNKQLDIRSMYALFYYMMDSWDYFYPVFCGRDKLSDYEEILVKSNIPENSSLYEKSMRTLDEVKDNQRIGDSLIELVEEGYELTPVIRGQRRKLIKR